MKISAIVLTFNESIHLDRCINNIKNVTNDIFIVDSFSDDNTKEIANENKTRFLERKFDNHSRQFNWALSQIDADTDWV